MPLNDSNIDPGTGTSRDLLLGPDGDLAFVAGDLVLARGTVATQQEVLVRMRFIRGEWFLDILAGVPYLEQVLTKPPNRERAQAVLAQAIAEAQGVARVDEVSVAYVGADRRLEASYRAVLDTSEEITGVASVEV